ncbi:hypothetical protein EPN95_02155 [Patescibacteria group bacterium]|nr:MAG: hypothetical protein EPN95_02155 [Patescibacteria group bacterium]
MTQTEDKLKKRLSLRWSAIFILIILLVFVAIWGSINIAPFRAFGGAIWFNHGSHYISDLEISNRIQSIKTPKETQIADSISKTTQSCNNVESGFCEKDIGTYVDKSVVSPAVMYQPGTPDIKTIIGYCTLCNDGTFSPSCAVGRGACSYHSGVAGYNVAQYMTTPGTPEIAAQPAVYSYEPKTYKDSPIYVPPAEPSLVDIISFAN